MGNAGRIGEEEGSVRFSHSDVHACAMLAQSESLLGVFIQIVGARDALKTSKRQRGSTVNGTLTVTTYV